jgi:hypothetical protein
VRVSQTRYLLTISAAVSDRTAPLHDSTKFEQSQTVSFEIETPLGSAVSTVAELGGLLFLFLLLRTETTSLADVRLESLSNYSTSLNSFGFESKSLVSLRF